MRTIAVIQARMGSTRLPGKAMLSLDCTPVIRHVVRRCRVAESVDDVVIATTGKDRDDVIARYARREGGTVFRGDETDVLGRVHGAAAANEAEVVIRITSDNPLTSPAVIDAAVKTIDTGEYDYVSNKVDRTFPAGLDVEVFTFDSFTKVERRSEDTYDREHVTPYYRRSNDFDVSNLASTEVFGERFLQDRTGLRLTMDTPDDFELFAKLYADVPYDGVLDVRDAIRYIDENDLADLNTD